MSYIDEHYDDIMIDRVAHVYAMQRYRKLPDHVLVKDANAIAYTSCVDNYSNIDMVRDIMDKIGDIPQNKFLRDIIHLSKNQKQLLCHFLVVEHERYAPNDEDYAII